MLDVEEDAVRSPEEAADDRSPESYLLSLLKKVLGGDLEPQKLVAAIAAYGRPQLEGSALALRLADAVWLAWAELEGSQDAEKKERLLAGLQHCLQGKLLSKRELLLTAESDLLEEAGIIVSRETWRRKEIRVNTKLVYQQRKFNLLREESEGYAKLTTLLHQSGAGRLTAETVPQVARDVLALIGFFDLDPNRVVSVLLGAWAEQAHNEAFLQLLAEFKQAEFKQVLGWEFERGVGSPHRDGLYQITNRLLEAGHVTLEEIMPHLDPPDDEFKAKLAQAGEELNAAVAKIGTVNLVEQGDRSTPGQFGLGRLSLDAQPLLDAFAHAAGQGNQKLALLAATLKGGLTAPARQLLAWAAAVGVEDVAAFPAVCDALLARLATQLREHEPGAALGADALDTLSLIGLHLNRDVRVLTKLLRALRAALEGPVAAESRQQVLDVLAANALPACTLVPANVPLTTELWHVLRCLTYPERYTLYADYQARRGGDGEQTQTKSVLLAAAKLAETEARRVLRRVTAPGNHKEAKAAARPLSRRLAKIAHALPLQISEQLIRQVMGMPGMVLTVAESLKLATPMTFDALTFVIMRKLSSVRHKLKADGVNTEEWFQWLAAFTGLICRKYPDIELPALLQYLANQLKSSDSLDLLFLKEILTAMTGTEMASDVSEHQLDALSGSRALHIEVFLQGQFRPSPRALASGTRRLLAALQREQPNDAGPLLVPLLILLCQQRRLITLQSDLSHLKLVAELYDSCQRTLLQYIEFMQTAMPHAEYERALPSLEDLVRVYAVEPELAFQLVRPLLRAALPRCAAPAPPEARAADGSLDAGAGDSEPEEGEAREQEAELANAPGAEAPADAAAARPSFAALWADFGPGIRALMDAQWAFRALDWRLYALFWTLELSDLEVPRERYAAAIKQVSTSLRHARDELGMAQRDSTRGYGGWPGGHGAPAADPLAPGLGPAATGPDMHQLEKEIERQQAVLDQLPRDLESQKRRAQETDALLTETAPDWLASLDPSARASFASEFATFCLLPRILSSPSDALYAARFLQRVQQLRVPRFGLLTTINHVIREFGFLVRCVTSSEAINFGIFFKEVLDTVERWKDAQVFERECAGTDAFLTWQGDKSAPITHQQYSILCFNWQKRLTEDVMRSCLRSEDYMQIKNALLLLNRCVKVYPASQSDARALLALVGPIRDHDAREDLKTLARMYCTALEIKLRDAKGRMPETREEYAGLPRKKGSRDRAARAAPSAPEQPPAADAREGAASRAASPARQASARAERARDADSIRADEGHRAKAPAERRDAPGQDGHPPVPVRGGDDAAAMRERGARDRRGARGDRRLPRTDSTLGDERGEGRSAEPRGDAQLPDPPREKRRREESLERPRRRSASREARSGPREEASEGRRDRGGLDGRSGRPREEAGGSRRRGEGKPAELRPESRADSYEKPPEDEADPGPSGREEKSRERRRSSRKEKKRHRRSREPSLEVGDGAIGDLGLRRAPLVCAEEERSKPHRRSGHGAREGESPRKRKAGSGRDAAQPGGDESRRHKRERIAWEASAEEARSERRPSDGPRPAAERSDGPRGGARSPGEDAAGRGGDRAHAGAAEPGPSDLAVPERLRGRLGAPPAASAARAPTTVLLGNGGGASEQRGRREGERRGRDHRGGRRH